MELDSLKASWRAGRTTLGAWMMLREPLAAEVAALAGYDYVCVDAQHGLVDERTVIEMVQAVTRTEATPLVRVAFNEPWLIGRALDAGALGVIVPMVNTAEEAAAAAAACRYAPDGTRSVGPVLNGNRHGMRYIGEANAAIACIVMIETREAVRNIEEIVSVPGIDAIYVGPADLSMSIGLPPGQDHPDAPFQDALRDIVAACRRHGVVPGVHASAALAATRHEQGFRMITAGFDSTPMFAGLRADLKTAREATLGSGDE